MSDIIFTIENGNQYRLDDIKLNNIIKYVSEIFKIIYFAKFISVT